MAVLLYRSPHNALTLRYHTGEPVTTLLIEEKRAADRRRSRSTVSLPRAWMFSSVAASARHGFCKSGWATIDNGGGRGPMSIPNSSETEGKDLPLRDDIRLLGRILGDTVREQSGAEVFDTVESIRQNSVRFRRNEDVTARRELEASLNSLPPTEALQIIRAFGFFSHLANIAEDQHHIRRTHAHHLTASAPREGTMAH